MRAICGVQLEVGNGSKYLMLILGLIEIIGDLAMVGSVPWYGYVLRREDGHVLRRAF